MDRRTRRAAELSWVPAAQRRGGVSRLGPPARKVAAAHKQELRRRLKGVAGRLRVKRPNELAGQLSLLINGAFVSSQILSAGEAVPLLRATARALITAARKR